MSSSFPNGAVFALGTTLASPIAFSAISNASPAVATTATQTYAIGDILLLSMPSRLDQRVVRLSAAASTSATLESIDTTSTTQYPSGFGVGSGQKVTAFTSLSQITDVSTSGGDQQFFQWTYLEDGRQRQRPTFKNARSINLQMDYDPALAWHAALLAADTAGTVYPLRVTLPSGVVIYYSAYVSFSGEPDYTINANQKTAAIFALASPFSTRY